MILMACEANIDPGLLNGKGIREKLINK